MNVYNVYFDGTYLRQIVARSSKEAAREARFFFGNGVIVKLAYRL